MTIKKSTTRKRKETSIFVIPKHLREKLREEAHQTDRSRSEIIREMLEGRYKTKTP